MEDEYHVWEVNWVVFLYTENVVPVKLIEGDCVVKVPDIFVPVVKLTEGDWIVEVPDICDCVVEALDSLVPVKSTDVVSVVEASVNSAVVKGLVLEMLSSMVAVNLVILSGWYVVDKEEVSSTDVGAELACKESGISWVVEIAEVWEVVGIRILVVVATSEVRTRK